MHHKTTTDPNGAQECTPIPDFERLKFYYGQLLGVADFQTEQRFFLEKLRLHNRCFHGVGIVCGLEVDPVPMPEDCDTEGEGEREELEKEIAQVEAQIAAATGTAQKNQKDDSQKRQLRSLQAERERLQRRLEELPECEPSEAPPAAEICVRCGWAIDCEGREIIVRQHQRLDLWQLLSAEQRQQVKQNNGQEESKILIELSICYWEQPTYPSRPIITDTCGPVSKCVYGRIREGFKFRVSLTPSEMDERCSNCCDKCDYDCVVLAHLHWNPEKPITSEDIDLRPRRSVSVYQPTVITGISWLHGAKYSADQAKILLGTEDDEVSVRTDGIEVVFSKPVYAETLQPGVVDLWRIHGGGGIKGLITHMEGTFVDKPETGTINSFRYRDESGETLDEGDRVLIIIRTDFILDQCCQPVDGEHIGGRVPPLDAYAELNDAVKDSLPPVPDCVEARRQPWTSGDGRSGGTFESWIFIN